MNKRIKIALLGVATVACLLIGKSVSIGAVTGITDISNVPLANSTGQIISPNIQFVLDDSGSMGNDYLPDSVKEASNYCKSGNKNGSTSTLCITGEPPAYNNTINGVYYNPNTTYTPPILPSGYSYAANTNLGKSMTAANTNNWTSVPVDSYKIQSTSSINLVTGYPDLQWCSGSYGSGTCYTNSNYNYPNSTYNYSNSISGNPIYYNIIPGEYCSDVNMTNCIAATSPNGSYTIPAYIRFCTDNTLSVCQRAYVEAGTTTYKYPRYPTLTQNAKAASATITVTSGNSNATITSIKVNGTTINTSNITGSSSTSTTASNIRSRIGNGFSATSSGNTVTITSPLTNAASYNGYSISVTYSNSNTLGLTTTVFANGVTSAVVPGSFQRVDIVPTTTTYPRASTRSDCAAASTCTYAEEMTNFANWYTYYRTRMQMMKTSASSTIGALSDTYRVGMFTINNNNNNLVTIANFNSTQKTAWLNSLFKAKPNNSTPLRTALDKAGRIYAGLDSTQDPVQYSCQQNFTFLATDGYWNESRPSYTGPTYGGDTSLSNPFYSPNNVNSITLADVAYYYYYTDLRPAGSTNSNGVDVSTNNVPAVSNNIIEGDFATWQHMTTFTMGLGLMGVLDYQPDYKTNNTGDYLGLKQGTVNWPTIVSNQQTTIDDLWHAAINGHGQYFSAKDPVAVKGGINSALATIGISTGTGSAAATSNLEPVAGDNYVYVASYRTNYWDGDVSSYTMNLTDGTLANTPTWSAQVLLDNQISADGNSDTRTIYTDDSTNTTTGLKLFTWSNLTTTEQSYFDNTKLTQYPLWTSATVAAATPQMLFNYVRGQNRNQDQDRDPSYGTYYRLYRARQHVLGDIVDAQPAYVGVPNKSYTDSGYASFKTANANRQKMLYVASNDGMLHAFDATTGQEQWAYVPKQMMPNLYKLADSAYPNNHMYYTDGSPIVGDVYDSVAGQWKTILVAGYNKGGKGYYALDITNPTSPKALWSKDDTNASFGYSFGKPVIGKDTTGAWKVFLSSGYNNVTNQGDGKGWLYSVNPITGAITKSISTGSGSLTLPSGFARFNSWVDDLSIDNTVLNIYGGDLNGDMWKFDPTAGTVVKLYNVGLPITVTPELGLVNNTTRVLMFGTGRYLGQSDLSDNTQQYIFAIKDDMSGTTKSSITNYLTLQQTSNLTTTTRGTTNNNVDWNSGYGWYTPLLDSGERDNIDPILQLGTLTVVTNVPTSQACSPSGYSWLYQFDYKTGRPVQTSSTSVNTVVATQLTSTTVGINVVKLPNGTVVILRSRSDSIKPDTTTMRIGNSGQSVKRVYWRQITQ